MSTREYKFRGRKVAEPSNPIPTGKWMYGDLFHGAKGAVFIHSLSVKGLSEIDPATIGQFTDKSDSKGAEIYEGDILKSYNSKLYGENEYVVKYEADGYIVENEAHDCDNLDTFCAQGCQIVGDIHPFTPNDDEEGGE